MEVDTNVICHKVKTKRGRAFQDGSQVHALFLESGLFFSHSKRREDLKETCFFHMTH